MKAAVALVLAPDAQGKAQALFIRRARHPKDPWSGQIGLPGGRREKGDADALATAIRETAEEVGLKLRRADCLGALDDMLPRGEGLPKIVIRPFVFRLRKTRPASAGAEVDAAFWLPLGELARNRRKAAVSVRGEKLQVQAYRAGSLVIWGATYRILSGFFSLLS